MIKHQKKMGRIVIPAMLIELISAGCLCLVDED